MVMVAVERGSKRATPSPRSIRWTRRSSASVSSARYTLAIPTRASRRANPSWISWADRQQSCAAEELDHGAAGAAATPLCRARALERVVDPSAHGENDTRSQRRASVRAPVLSGIVLLCVGSPSPLVEAGAAEPRGRTTRSSRPSIRSPGPSARSPARRRGREPHAPGRGAARRRAVSARRRARAGRGARRVRRRRFPARGRGRRRRPERDVARRARPGHRAPRRREARPARLARPGPLRRDRARDRRRARRRRRRTGSSPSSRASTASIGAVSSTAGDASSSRATRPSPDSRRATGSCRSRSSGSLPRPSRAPGSVERLVDEVRASGATTVFAEPLVSARLAETVAREAGVEVAVLDPIEGLTAQRGDRGRRLPLGHEDESHGAAEGLGCGRHDVRRSRSTASRSRTGRASTFSRTS